MRLNAYWIFFLITQIKAAIFVLTLNVHSHYRKYTKEYQMSHGSVKQTPDQNK